ncbi:hypothetical protein DMB66_55375 [Actinoplanes sp. ATCC 53533]|uniref:hypothetical protein n=1 Tax=Actinoplanes sp. ATCC 53533 TaxID=1288362 RepID=UPI000F7A2B4E|nr:hypothetical protein [Actinoplanes sp. ATCC 53533]RSM41950.1 hypothetical protein DMB66_55375 [Actinoplanes sp. ATCC 53533]
METLQAQVAALDAADEHRRAELAGVRAETTEAQASAREARARAEERRHLIEALREQLGQARAAAVQPVADDGGAKVLSWRRRCGARS